MGWGDWALIALLVFLTAVAIYDVLQTKKAVLRNFPVIGHLRYLFEAVGPELRQYIVTGNDEERPFSRDQRRWVYASAKKENNYFGFGTDTNLESASNHLIIKHATFPVPDPLTVDPLHFVPCAKVWGEAGGRTKAFRPDSVISISAMSYGSLSANAIEALNRGAKLSNTLHNTGEGGISPFHAHGGDLIYQLGTGYFGARTHEGRFDMAMLLDKVARFNVRAVEIKLSQGAKPGRGGVSPGAKVNELIATIRGVPVGRDVISPAHHTAFSDADSLLDSVEGIAQATGLPVGIKSAVGELGFWQDLARLMDSSGRGVDFIQIDGGEGGTGAAPLVLAIGCIQAQQCHTDMCPTGVATHNRWLMRGLDPTDKSARLANFIVTLRKELMWLVHATGHHHPYELTLEDFEVLKTGFATAEPRQLFGYRPEWRMPRPERSAALRKLMRS